MRFFSHVLAVGTVSAFLQPNLLTDTIRVQRKSTRLRGEGTIAFFDPVTSNIPPGGKTRELPLFPLGLVTCPSGKCPLHIFEMRYRQLMNNIASGDNRFGIVLYDSSTQKIAQIGTIVEVVERSLLPDGRQLIMNMGVERFKLLRITQEKPYIIGLVEIDLKDEEPSTGEAKIELAQKEELVWELVQDVVRLSNKVYDNSKVTISETVTQFAPNGAKVIDDNERRSSFSFSIAEMLDIQPFIKQLMLQTSNVGERFDIQIELLDKAQKYLAAKSTIKSALG